MCQTAAPGNGTVAMPALRARTPYSMSSHLMKNGSDSPTLRMTSSGIRHIHQAL
jgi:hypothetical protein